MGLAASDAESVFCRQVGHQTGKEVKGEDSPAFKKHPPACFEFGMVM